MQPVGRLDAGAVPAFERQLAEASFLGNERLLVDLSRIDFVGSLALRSLMTFARKLGSTGGKLAVFAPPAVAQVFITSGLNEVIPVHHTLAQTRAALHG